MPKVRMTRALDFLIITNFTNHPDSFERDSQLSGGPIFPPAGGSALPRRSPALTQGPRGSRSAARGTEARTLLTPPWASQKGPPCKSQGPLLACSPGGPGGPSEVGGLHTHTPGLRREQELKSGREWGQSPALSSGPPGVTRVQI